MVGARTYRWLSKFRAAASPDPRVRVCVCVNTCEYLHADALASRDWLLSYRLYVRAEAVIAAVSRVYVHHLSHVRLQKRQAPKSSRPFLSI